MFVSIPVPEIVLEVGTGVSVVDCFPLSHGGTYAMTH